MISAVTLFPVGLAPGQYATPGVSHKLEPRCAAIGRRDSTMGPWTFRHGMRMLALMVRAEDAAFGWMLDAGTLRLPTDAISPIQHGDVPLAIFLTEAGRKLSAAWERAAFLYDVPFHPSAYLGASAAAEFRFGLTVVYSDVRCGDGGGDGPPRFSAADLAPTQAPSTRVRIDLPDPSRGEVGQEFVVHTEPNQPHGLTIVAGENGTMDVPPGCTCVFVLVELYGKRFWAWRGTP